MGGVELQRAGWAASDIPAGRRRRARGGIAVGEVGMERPRGHLPKASELWREAVADGRTLTGPGVPFERAFPTVADVTVYVRWQGARDRVFRRGSFGPYIDCDDPACDGGGFRIQSILERMVRDHKITHESVQVCQGQERLPGRGRKPGRVRGPCTRTYQVRVELQFVEVERT